MPNVRNRLQVHTSQAMGRVQSERPHSAVLPDTRSPSVSALFPRDPISVFIDTISQARAEEWRKKVLCLEQLTEALDRQRLECKARNDDASDTGDDDLSLGTLESDISGMSSPQSFSARQQTYRSNRGALSGSRSVSGMGGYGGLSSPSVPSRVRVPASPRTPLSRRSPSAAPTNNIMDRPLVKQPKELRRLSMPFQKLLTDLRSQVVKAACITLQNICIQSGDAMRYLLKEILKDLVEIHRQTLKVMHTYAETAMLTIWQHVTMKYSQGVAFLIQQAKTSKTKEVRCACVKYLGEIVHSWPRYIDAEATRRKTACPLSEVELERVTQAFVSALSDSSQAVRQEARLALVHSLRVKYPMLWKKWITTRESTIITDSRIRSMILSAAVEAEEADADEKASNPTETTIETELHQPVNTSPLSTDGSFNQRLFANDVNDNVKPPIVYRNPFDLSPMPDGPGSYQNSSRSLFGKEECERPIFSPLQQAPSRKPKRGRESSMMLHRHLTRLSITTEASSLVSPPAHPNAKQEEFQAICKEMVQTHKKHLVQTMELLEQEEATIKACEAKCIKEINSPKDMIDRVVEYFVTMEQGLEKRVSLNEALEQWLTDISSRDLESVTHNGNGPSNQVSCQLEDNLFEDDEEGQDE